MKQMIAWLAAAGLMAAYPAAPVLAGQPANLLRDPGFEQNVDGRSPHWGPFEQGYVLDAAVRRSGSFSARCANTARDQRRGATYALKLDQKQPAPVLVTGWSRAQDVGGSLGYDYALYIDLTYTDGTPLYAQVAPFSVGTHDWQRRQVLVVPSKPIGTLYIHALFRSHTGTAWFDDFTAAEMTGTGVFDSQALEAPRLGPGQRRGWFVRDVAAGSPIRPLPERKGAAVLGLTALRRQSRASGADVTVADTTARDRAVTIYYVERFDAPQPRWWNDVRHSLPAAGLGDRLNGVRVGNVGAAGVQSVYPFACVTGRGRGRMLGLEAGQGPRVARLGYHHASRLLYAAFDVSLTAGNLANNDGKGHGTARVGVVSANVDPAWGFRSAALAYYRLSGDLFKRRADAEGIWIPFADPAAVQGVGDFGIAYHEGDNSVASDDRLGILSFRYTEPMTWWMPMPKGTPREYDVALGMVRDHLKSAGEAQRWAQSVINTGTHDEDGRLNVEFVNAPWTDGAVWTLNPNPRMPRPPGEWTKGRMAYDADYVRRTYAPDASPRLDGEYLDSIEGWADVLDFRAESLRHAPAPLTFTANGHRPCLPTWFSVYALAETMSADLHRRGKLLFANATPWRVHAFMPLLDVAGTETDWNRGGKWQPDSDAVFCLRRTLSYRKPYLLLQNTDFNRFGPAEVERYFQRSMAYGVFPSMFSVDASTDNYWTMPGWYNRDRELFKRYIPVVKRLSAAGWEPITHARSSNPRVYVERFGRDLVTLLNDSASEQRCALTFDLAAMGEKRARGTLTLRDEVTGQAVAQAPLARTVRVEVSLVPEQARALRLEAR